MASETNPAVERDDVGMTSQSHTNLLNESKMILDGSIQNHLALGAASVGYVEIFTDGACSGNPGPGGWGAILRWGDVEKELYGFEKPTTNNRMEMMAAIMALEALKRPLQVKLHTDSRYLSDGITKFIHGWKKNDWKTADKKPVKNIDLWLRLDAALKGHRVEWIWVKGHAGHPENERADALARRGVDDAKTA